MGSLNLHEQQLSTSLFNDQLGRLDPRLETNLVETADGRLGTSLTIAIIDNVKPNIEGTNVEKIGENRYKAILTPEKTGVYFIGDYGWP
jgi:hypothetical protein